MATGTNVYPVGSLVRQSTAFTDLTTGNPTDPAIVSLEWQVVPNGTGSAGATTTWTYNSTGSIVRDGTGLYHADLDTTGVPGQWQGLWICPPGGGQTVTDWVFVVTPSDLQTITGPPPAPDSWAVIDAGGQVFNVMAFNATGDGVTDDTIAVQNAVNKAQLSGGVVFFPPGRYLMTKTLSPGGSGPFSMQGAGPASRIRASATFTGTWLCDLTFGIGAADVQISDMTFEASLNPTLNLLRVGNSAGPTDGLIIRHCKFRYGAYALAIDGGCTQFTVRDVRIQNSTAGMHITNSTAQSQPNGVIDNVQVSITDNTVTTTQGLLIDTYMTGLALNAFQAKGTASNVFNAGIVVNVSTPTGTNGEFVQSTNCVTDGITGPGLSLTNCRQWQSTNDFWSSLVSTANYGVVINGGSYFRFTNCEISGSGVQYLNAPDDIAFSSCEFPATGTTAGVHQMPGANPPTNIQLDPTSLNYSSHGTPQLTNTLGTFYTALTSPASLGFVPVRLTVNGPVIENFPADKITTNNTALTLGSVFMMRIWLPKGLPINTFYWCVGSTPFTAGTTTHYWMALYAATAGIAAGNALVQSTDNTGPTLSVSTVQAVSTSAQYVTTATGYYFVSLFLSSTGGSPTAPTVQNFAGVSGITNLNPKFCYIEQTGYASGTAPNASGSSAGIGNEFWCGVG